MLELTRRLTEAFGVSGFEDEICGVIRDELDALKLETRVDALGNLIVHRPGTGGKRILLAAHMDQIGLMVTHVDAHGYLRFAQVGYLPPHTCVGSQVRFADGTYGTIGLDGRGDTAHLQLNNMYVDTGAAGGAAPKQQVGDVAVFWRPFVSQGHAWFAPNMDDRIGCVVLVELLRSLQGQEIAHDLHVVFTTQEEVGTRGATTIAYAVDPDIAIALDVTLTGDTPHATPYMAVRMGNGVAIKVRDAGMISHVGLNRQLVAAAERDGIPYQMEVLQGGTTDARNMQMARAGVPASCLSIPSRHVHAPSQIVDGRDVDAAVKLLVSFLSANIEL